MCQFKEMSYTFLVPIDPIDIALRWSAGIECPCSYRHSTPLEWGTESWHLRSADMSFGWSREVGVLNPSGQLLDTANCYDGCGR